MPSLHTDSAPVWCGPHTRPPLPLRGLAVHLGQNIASGSPADHSAGNCGIARGGLLGRPETPATPLCDLPGLLLAAAPGRCGAGVPGEDGAQGHGGPERAAYRGGAHCECQTGGCRAGGAGGSVPETRPPANHPPSPPTRQNATLAAEKAALQGQLQHLEGQLGSLQGRAQELLLQSQRAQENSSRLQVGPAPHPLLPTALPRPPLLPACWPPAPPSVPLSPRLQPSPPRPAIRPSGLPSPTCPLPALCPWPSAPRHSLSFPPPSAFCPPPSLAPLSGLGCPPQQPPTPLPALA